MNTDDNTVIRSSEFTAVYTLLCFSNHETSWCVYSVMLQAKRSESQCTHIVGLGLSLSNLILVQSETGRDPAEPNVSQHVLVICHAAAGVAAADAAASSGT